MKSTIELTGLFNVNKGPRDKSWVATVAVDWEKVPVELWPDLLAHGVKQKVADAASGAKNEAEASAAMFKALDAIYAGEWSSRGSGEGLSDIRAIAVHRLFRALLDGDDLKRFRKLSTSDQVRKALENVAAFTDDAIAEEVATIEAERKAKADADAARKEAVAEMKGKIKIDF